MTQDAFWALIAKDRTVAGDDHEAFLFGIRNELPTSGVDELVSFQEVFDEYHGNAYSWDLWAAAYVIVGGCSDDSFVDFRAWLISKGRETYEKTLSNPDSLAYLDLDKEPRGCMFEDFNYIAMQA